MLKEFEEWAVVVDSAIPIRFNSVFDPANYIRLVDER